MPEQSATPAASQRGFAAMDREKQKQIASMGGKAAHAKGTAHEFTSAEAAAAGSKGGKAAHEKGTAHEFSREEAAAAGRKGGQASGARSKAPRMQQMQQMQQPQQPAQENMGDMPDGNA